uniref:RNA polymerase III subunit GL n=1 Tax=Gallus gallus TaxID=9031 RepID=A0A8V1AHI5_CHICK
MASRGRARGRGALTFSTEAVGIGKGDALPPPTLQPSPLFPAVECRAVPLPGGEEVEYMLALKQELRGAMKGLPYFVRPGAPHRDIERYSDKYQLSSPIDGAIEWNPDWRRFPRELKIRVRRLRKGRHPSQRHQLPWTPTPQCPPPRGAVSPTAVCSAPPHCAALLRAASRGRWRCADGYGGGAVGGGAPPMGTPHRPTVGGHPTPPPQIGPKGFYALLCHFLTWGGEGGGVQMGLEGR